MDQKCMNLYVTSKIDEYMNNLNHGLHFPSTCLNEENVDISYLRCNLCLIYPKSGRQLYAPSCWGEMY
jgi:hypothetical protein